MSEIPRYLNRQLYLVFALAFVLCLAGPAGAVTYTYTFDAITSNNATNATAGEAQLRMAVTGGDNTPYVICTFYHEGSAPMSITRIYFYYKGGSLEGTNFNDFIFIPPWNVNTKKGVEFQRIEDLENIPNLPGAKELGLTKNHIVESFWSNDPVVKKGINPGESLGIIFSLPQGKDIDDLVQALNGWITDRKFDSGDLVVGLKVQGFQGGGSESFVVVPLPGSVLLLGSGLLGLVLVYRRRRGKKAA